MDTEKGSDQTQNFMPLAFLAMSVWEYIGGICPCAMLANTTIIKHCIQDNFPFSVHLPNVTQNDHFPTKRFRFRSNNIALDGYTFNIVLKIIY